jgi:flagellar biosynthesis regulator FlbT
MITKKTYVTAAFIDADRKNIEVLLNMDHTDAKTLTPHVIEADPDSKDYQDLLKIVSEDKLHEQTWNTRKQESDAMIAMARELAKGAGIVDEEVQVQELVTTTKLYPTLVDAIFSNMENEDHLFALKLALFGIQEIKDSTNVAEKTALRKGKNKIEVLQHAFNITGVRSLNEDTIAPTSVLSEDRITDDGDYKKPVVKKKTTTKKTTTKKKT